MRKRFERPSSPPTLQNVRIEKSLSFPHRDSDPQSPALRQQLFVSGQTGSQQRRWGDSQS